MKIEEETNKEVEMTVCSWCGKTDAKKKELVVIGDDMENPRLYHPRCKRVLRVFTFISMGNSEDSVEEMIKQAEAIVGIET